jgi:predicted RNA-binding Zn ribbon-like protein
VPKTEQQPGGREPAPGPLGLVQAFVNTHDIEGRRDELARPARAQAWLRDHGLLGADETVNEADFVWLLDVRDALRALALANNRLPLDERAVALLDEAATRTLTIHFDRAGSAVRPSDAGVARAIGRLLAIVVDAIQDGTWARMKACRRDVCRWLFYDHSRNRGSSWCSMAICGNRSKTRAYRRRRKQARAGEANEVG